MKVAPVSADLLIKLAIGGVVAYAVYIAFAKGMAGIQGAIDSVTSLPRDIQKKAQEVLDNGIAAAKEGGATWQDGYKPDPNYSNEGRNYTPKYSNPLVNSQGYDFGQLSG